MRRGWFRLWIVVSAIFVPAIAWQFSDSSAKFWEHYNANWEKACGQSLAVLQPTDPHEFPDITTCVHANGGDQNLLQHEHATFAWF